jgi:uncharacterized protein involved in type VI secretion and phage assembly
MMHHSDTSQASRSINSYFGVYPGIVVDNKDPENRYRAKVKFPWMMESDTKYTDTADKENMNSTWCRIANTMAGTVAHGGSASDKLRGDFFLPEVDDEVLVVFMFGSFREPIIIGQMYNGKDMPFWQNKDAKGVQKAGDNNLRGWRSRSGHMIAFVDKGTGDADRIVIQTNVKDDNVYDQPAIPTSVTVSKAMGGTASVKAPDGTAGGHVIVLDQTAGKENILVADKSGKLVFHLDTVKETISLYSSKDININATKTLSIKCETLKVESGKDTNFKAGTTWKQESGGTMDLKAGGNMTLKGGPDINLN